MKVSVVRPTDLGAGEREQWRKLQRSNAGLSSPFLDVGFALAVSTVKENARVAILEEAGTIVGFFPYEIGKLGFARAIGAGVNDCQAVVRDVNTRIDPLRLINDCGLRMWEFDHLQMGNDEFSQWCRQHHASAIIDVSQGFDAYVESKRESSTKLIKSVRAQSRRLERDLGTVEVLFDTSRADEYDQVIAWKRQQYARTNAPDVLNKSWVRDLLDVLRESDDSDCHLAVSVLRAGGRTIAGHLGLSSTQTLASWFPSYDVQQSRYSPGIVLALGFIEESANTGREYVDLGKGRADYKDRLKTRDVFVGEGWISDQSAAAWFRGAQREGREAVDRWAKGQLRDRQRARKIVRRTRRAWSRLRPDRI